MSTLPLIALSAGLFFLGVGFGLFIAGMCQAASRGGTVDLTGIQTRDRW